MLGISSLVLCVVLLVNLRLTSSGVHHNVHHMHNLIDGKQDPRVFRGAHSLTKANNTIYGAVIMMDYLGEMSELLAQEKAKNITSSHKLELASSRRAKIMELVPQLPFPIAEWPPLRVAACPNDDRSKHGSSERGLMWAHYQVILDFAYFDWDVQEKYEVEGGMADGSIYKGTTYSAVSGKFVAVGPNPPKQVATPGDNNKSSEEAHEDGGIDAARAEAENNPPKSKEEEEEDRYYFSMGPGLYKDGIPFRDDDILVMFEDDAEIAIKDVKNTLIEEFNDMDGIDLLYLGWCEGRTARPIPLCTHAYALTRRGARKLIDHYEPCGPAYDWLLVNLIRNKWLVHRPAHSFSYQANYKEGFSNGATRGIFQQSKGSVSFNHNR
jgi:hypothetical protein